MVHAEVSMRRPESLEPNHGSSAHGFVDVLDEFRLLLQVQVESLLKSQHLLFMLLEELRGISRQADEDDEDLGRFFVHRNINTASTRNSERKVDRVLNIKTRRRRNRSSVSTNMGSSKRSSGSRPPGRGTGAHCPRRRRWNSSRCRSWSTRVPQDRSPWSRFEGNSRTGLRDLRSWNRISPVRIWDATL